MTQRQLIHLIVWGEEKSEDLHGEKPLRASREPTTNSAHMAVIDPRISTWATLIGAECSHPCTSPYYCCSFLGRSNSGIPAILLPIISICICIRDVTKISSCWVNTTRGRGTKQLGISFGFIFLLMSYESSQGPHSQQPGENPSSRLLMTALCILFCEKQKIVTVNCKLWTFSSK